MKPSYPYSSPVTLPILQGQGAPQFDDFRQDEWLTTSEVAAQLRVAKETICSAISSGELKASFLGRKYLVRSSDLNLWVAGRQRKPRIKVA